jgi:hypothetical protein
MRSHFSLGSSTAIACAVSGATAMLTGICSAQIAADSATDPIYSGGWSAGQNGGHGFTAWSFSGTGTSPIQQTMNTSSPFNQLGTAWTLFNPNGGLAGGDIARAGRGFAPLQPGQTLETIIDNPTQRSFYRGYTIVLSHGSDNIQYGGAGTQISVGTFEYFTYGKWYTTSTFSHGGTSLFDTDTAAGLKLDITMTSASTYHLVMTPLGNPAIAYSEDATLALPAEPVNWITFQLYNTTSNPNAATDFYISSITIVPEPSGLALIGLGSAGLLFLRRRN